MPQENFITSFLFACQRLQFVNENEFEIQIPMGGWRFDGTVNRPNSIQIGLCFKEKLSREPAKKIARIPNLPDLPPEIADCWETKQVFKNTRAHKIWEENLYKYDSYPTDQRHVELRETFDVPIPYCEWAERFRQFSSIQCQIGKYRREQGGFSPYFGATYNAAVFAVNDSTIQSMYEKVAPYTDDPYGVVYSCLEEAMEPVCFGKPRPYEPYQGHYLHTWHGSVLTHEDIFTEYEYYDWIQRRVGRDWLLAVDELMALNDPQMNEVMRSMNIPWCFLVPQGDIEEVAEEDDPVLELESECPFETIQTDFDDILEEGIEYASSQDEYLDETESSSELGNFADEDYFSSSSLEEEEETGEG